MERSVKVLVVDDSEFQAEVLEATLEGFDLNNITKAVNGAHALMLFGEALTSAAPFDLVFLDIVMPEMDGQEALKRMRQLEKERGIAPDDKTVMIMTTTLDSPDSMIQALLEGDCTDYIVKPVLECDLKRMLTKYGLLNS